MGLPKEQPQQPRLKPSIPPFAPEEATISCERHWNEVSVIPTKCRHPSLLLFHRELFFLKSRFRVSKFLSMSKASAFGLCISTRRRKLHWQFFALPGLIEVQLQKAVPDNLITSYNLYRFIYIARAQEICGQLDSSIKCCVVLGWFTADSWVQLAGGTRQGQVLLPSPQRAAKPQTPVIFPRGAGLFV